MIKVGVCTKEREFSKYVTGLIRGILPENDKYEFIYIDCGALLDREKEMFDGYPVIIIDEKLFRENGISTVEYMSRIRSDAEIILVEGEKESSASGMRYHVFAYQMRRLKQQELTKLLSEKLKNAAGNPRCIVIRYDGDEITVPLKSILYAESKNRHIILHTLIGEYEYGERIGVLEELLSNDGFVRCHQSFIVSKRYVTDINSEGIWIEQECIPVGRTYKDVVRREFFYDRNPEESKNRMGTEKNIIKYTEKQGVLLGTKGLYKGVEFHFRPEEKIIVGRSETSADIVLDLPLISRLHCVLVFHEKDNSYEVVDFSKNGTFINDKKRLASDTSYVLKPGTIISFGDSDNVYKLG